MEKKQIKINGKIAVEIKINGGLFWKAGGPEPSEPNNLVYSTNAAGSKLTVNGETVTLGQGDNITLEYPTAITSVKATNNTALTYIQIPNTVTKIENSSYRDGAFYGCTALASVTLSDSLTTIGCGAFGGCPLTSINIPEGVTEIVGGSGSPYEGAFADCLSLVSVTLPESLKIIGNFTFYQCTTLTEVNYNGTMEQWSSISLGNRWKYSAPFTVVHCTDGDVTL